MNDCGAATLSEMTVSSALDYRYDDTLYLGHERILNTVDH